MKNLGKNTMLKFDDAFEIVMGSACLLGTERVSINRALNRILAKDVVAEKNKRVYSDSFLSVYGSAN